MALMAYRGEPRGPDATTPCSFGTTCCVRSSAAQIPSTVGTALRSRKAATSLISTLSRVDTRLLPWRSSKIGLGSVFWLLFKIPEPA